MFPSPGGMKKLVADLSPVIWVSPVGGHVLEEGVGWPPLHRGTYVSYDLFKIIVILFLLLVISLSMEPGESLPSGF